MKCFWFFCLPGLIACKQMQDVTHQPAPDPTEIISWKNGPCFGNCPVFTFTVFSDGKVYFWGKVHTNVDSFTEDLETEEFNYLIQLFEKSEIELLDSSYQTNITDVSTSSIKYRDYLVKCKGEKPPVFQALEKELEHLLNQWNVYDARLYPTRETDPASMIVQLKTSSDFIILIRKYPQFYLRFEKFISRKSKLILLSYDDEVEASTVLETLKKDPLVESVEQNKRLNRR